MLTLSTATRLRSSKRSLSLSAKETVTNLRFPQALVHNYLTTKANKMTAIIVLCNGLIADTVSDRGNHSFINRGKLIRQSSGLVWGGAGLCYSPPMIAATNLVELESAIKADGPSRCGDAYLAHWEGRAWMGTFEKEHLSWSEAHIGAIIGCYHREWLNSLGKLGTEHPAHSGPIIQTKAIDFMSLIAKLSGFSIPLVDSYTLEQFSS